MRKNFTLLFLIGIFGLFSTNLFAQEDATINPEDINYWIGEGENEVVVAISWCSYTETALAWGYRFDGEATVFQALTDIAAADDRLTVIGSAPTNITYVDDVYNLTMCPNPDAQWGDPDYDVPMHSVNGLMGMNMMAAEPIQNNDFVKIGGYACGIMSDDWTTIAWEQPIDPVSIYDGVNEQSMTLSVYPNPAKSAFTVTGRNLKAAEVVNTLGQRVAAVQGKGETLQIDIANLPTGIYFVNITDEEGRKCVKKVVKE